MQLLWLSFMLYMFTLGGTVYGLFSPSTSLLNLIICIALWLAILATIRDAQDMMKLIFVAPLAVWYVLTAFLSIYPRMGYEATVYRLLYLATFVVAWRTAQREGGNRYIAMSLLVACAFEVTLSLIQWLTWLPRRPPGEPFERVLKGTLNHPNDLALFLVIALPLWIAFAVEEQKKFESKLVVHICTAGAVATLFCLLLTCSRSGYAGLIAILLSSTAIMLRRKSETARWLKQHALIVAVAVAVLLIGVLLVPGNWVIRRLVAMFTHIDISVYNRIAMWHYTAKMSMSKWINGVGAGCYPLAYTKFIPQGGVREIPLHPHNFYLHIAAETGLVGLALFIAPLLLCLILSCGRILGSRHGSASAYEVATWCAVVGFLVSSIGNSELEIPAIMCAFAVTVGICASSASLGHIGIHRSANTSTKKTMKVAIASLALFTPLALVALLFGFRYSVAHLLFVNAMHEEETEARLRGLRLAIKLDPTFAYYHAQLGLMEFKRGRLDEALKCFEVALKCFDEDALYWHNIAQIKLCMLCRLLGSWGRTMDEMKGEQRAKAYHLIEDAVKALSRALSLDPSNEVYSVKLNSARALLEESRGNLRVALTMLEQVAKSGLTMPAWVAKHAKALAFKLKADASLFDRATATAMYQKALHLPVRYRRIGYEDEAIEADAKACCPQ